MQHRTWNSGHVPDTERQTDELVTSACRGLLIQQQKKLQRMDYVGVSLPGVYSGGVSLSVRPLLALASARVCSPWEAEHVTVDKLPSRFLLPDVVLSKVVQKESATNKKQETCKEADVGKEKGFISTFKVFRACLQTSYHPYRKPKRIICTHHSRVLRGVLYHPQAKYSSTSSRRSTKDAYNTA